MKTAVSIPDITFAKAEGLARQLGISRSKLYARALDKLLSAQAADDVTALMDAAIGAAAGEPDGFARQAARRVLAQTEW